MVSNQTKPVAKPNWQVGIKDADGFKEIVGGTDGALDGSNDTDGIKEIVGGIDGVLDGSDDTDGLDEGRDDGLELG